MITNEVAFVAIAVSDKERARKFYQETLELKPTTTAMDGAWIEYDLGPVTIGVGCHPAWKPSRDGTTVAFGIKTWPAAARCRSRLFAKEAKETGTYDAVIVSAKHSTEYYVSYCQPHVTNNSLPALKLCQRRHGQP